MTSHLLKWLLLKRQEIKKCWEECREKGTLQHCQQESKLLQPLWKTVWTVLKILRELSYDLAIPLLNIYPKKTKTLTGKDTFNLMFIAALFIIAIIQMQPKSLSINKWINNLSRILFTQKKGNFAACDTDSPGEHYAERNKSDRKTILPCNAIYMWSLKMKTSSQTQRTYMWLPEAGTDMCVKQIKGV